MTDENNIRAMEVHGEQSVFAGDDRLTAMMRSGERSLADLDAKALDEIVSIIAPMQSAAFDGVGGLEMSSLAVEAMLKIIPIVRSTGRRL